MRNSRKTPTAAPPTVCRVMWEILDAKRESVFTQKTLEQMGISRSALTLMRFLNLLTSSGGLQDDVFNHRGDTEGLAELLADRLKVAFEQVDCDAAMINELARPDLTPSQLDELLRSLPLR